MLAHQKGSTGRCIHLSLTQEDLAFKLPAYDNPEEVGYVSPGVIQILTDMKENDDKFFISKNLVTVTCKPKLVYSSSATDLLNDMYRIRLHYPDEHEVHDNVVENSVYCEKEICPNLFSCMTLCVITCCNIFQVTF